MLFALRLVASLLCLHSTLVLTVRSGALTPSLKEPHEIGDADDAVAVEVRRAILTRPP